MGMIPARALDTEGVTSLRALQAPFLSAPMTWSAGGDGGHGQRDAGRARQGWVTGLALVPESQREMFSFGKPFLTLRDFKGTTVRAPRSGHLRQGLKALGATADDPNGDEFDQRHRHGTIDAASPHWPWRHHFRPTTATANLVLYPKINSVVVNQAKFAPVHQAQQDMLREAATKTRDWGADVMPEPAQQAVQYCESGRNRRQHHRQEPRRDPNSDPVRVHRPGEGPTNQILHRPDPGPQVHQCRADTNHSM